MNRVPKAARRCYRKTNKRSKERVYGVQLNHLFLSLLEIDLGVMWARAAMLEEAMSTPINFSIEIRKAVRKAKATTKAESINLAVPGDTDVLENAR